MTYDEAVDYILNIPKFTKKNSLEHTRQCLRFLGNPERELKVIHVAGTNGKGSVCVYVEAMLRSEGKSAGLFVSPHLVRMNERIRIRGEQISDREFVRVFEKVMEKVREMERQGFPHPTFFEILFGMAVTAFADAGVEYAVLETGLGGRLDATNAVEHPAVTAIASIGMDHREILGDTLEQIAAEKAGILKKHVPVFYSEGAEASNRVIEERAAGLGISCKKIGKNAFENLRIEHKNIAFSCTNAYYG
ncbi:MAG: bifunctional folylpolyglutamate synthase/dihydrofolate synthase, partial [Ruminococcus sp.]|nr:bifunctional folylpolyglutamate synthase/dihydrofolate synthase [Ruminococcus sp.]